MTPLQQLAPDLVRDGLVKNCDWVQKACERVAELFTERSLRLKATFLAALHPMAVDYILQAPVLVLAIFDDRDLSFRIDRLVVAQRFTLLCATRPRLKVLMRHYGLAPQLRTILPQAIIPSGLAVLKQISSVPPSTLAQIIPDDVCGQTTWLAALREWVRHARRYFQKEDLLLEWAARNLQEAGRDVAMIADFAGNNTDSFNGAWSLASARLAAERWHDEILQKRESARGGMETLSTSAYPTTWTSVEPFSACGVVGEFSFSALRTWMELDEEGQAMHNCVGTFTDRMLVRESRLFSIRKAGRRVATLDIGNNILGSVSEGPFEVAQLRGPCNQDVDQAVILAAETFIFNTNRALDEKRLVKARSKLISCLRSRMSGAADG
jgi:hypothetical protein